MKNSHQNSNLPECFDRYIIEPCNRFPQEGCPGQFTFEECEPDAANTWTLYGHIPHIGVKMVGHFDSRQEAEEVFARITGSSYAANSEPQLEVSAPKLLISRQIAAVWSIEDVQEIRPDLDDDQAGKVLQAVEESHDANCGIGWDTLDYMAERLYPQADDE